MEFSILRKYAHSNCETNLFEVFKLIAKQKKVVCHSCVYLFLALVRMKIQKKVFFEVQQINFLPNNQGKVQYSFKSTTNENPEKSPFVIEKDTMHNRMKEMAISGDGVFIMKGCEKRINGQRFQRKKVFLLIMH